MTREGRTWGVGTLVLGVVIFVLAWRAPMPGRGEAIVERVSFFAGFSDVTGLEVGAPVELSGMPVGVVEEIRLRTNPARPALVRFGVEPEPARHVRTDSVVRLAPHGLLGGGKLEILAGQPGSPLAQPGAELRGKEGSADVGTHVENLVQSAVEISKSPVWQRNPDGSSRFLSSLDRAMQQRDRKLSPAELQALKKELEALRAQVDLTLTRVNAALAEAETEPKPAIPKPTP